MNSFSELNLNSALHKNLARLGFEKPTAVQAGSIAPTLEGRDLVATSQTGSGKTLAFALPIVERACASGTSSTRPRALILSPTRELAIQVEETFAKISAGTRFRSAVVVGGVDERRQLRTLKTGVDAVVATPGRLCDFLQRKLIDLKGVETLVLDEADRMLDMGFLPSIREILKAVPTNRQTLLFSATIEKSVAHLIETCVRNPVRVEIGASSKPAENVTLRLCEVEHDGRIKALTGLLHENSGNFLVFARTRRGTDRLARHLSHAGIRAARIHGDRTQGQRNQALQGFRDGSFRVLVATDVAARGIHIDGIAHVVNYDLPQVPEDFIHRVGRTGRAGARGTAWTFSSRSERGEIRRLERALNVRLSA
ncbi:MAG TPA: DEAD/DEAH box helicase [Bryobacteraceae bacterium]|nr:DEAD/DEAH box helicase [Bryobacteraceae bacterium]